MKIAFLVLVIAVAAASTSPVKLKPIDWTKVSEELEASHVIVYDTAVKLKELAIAGDKDIGDKIAEGITKAAKQGELLFEVILAAVADQTLTADQFNLYLEEIGGIWEVTLEELEELINSLPENVVKEMGDVFTEALKAFEIIANNIVTLLSQ